MASRGVRVFAMVRDNDATGISGTGHVADGVQFPSGKCAVVWRTKVTSCAFYDSIYDVRAIHGHGGMTRIVWEDVCDGHFRSDSGQLIECILTRNHTGDHYCNQTGFRWEAKPQLTTT